MKAMIFAAGLGSRLKPLTDTMPKALVTIKGRPLLQIVIEKLINSGFNDIVINVHHFAEQIIRFLEANNYFNININISDETRQLLETGGGIKKAAPFFDNNHPFLVHNVDILSNVNLTQFYQYSLANNAASCLLVSSRPSSRYLLFNENNELSGWLNEKTGETKSPYQDFDPSKYNKYAFGGIHIISPSLFQFMNLFEEKPFSIIDFYLSFCNQIPIKAYFQKDLKLIDVGKIETLNKLNQ